MPMSRCRCCAPSRSSSTSSRLTRPADQSAGLLPPNCNKVVAIHLQQAPEGSRMSLTTQSTESSGANRSSGGVLARLGAGLTPAERRRLIGMFSFITLMHLVGWGILLFVVQPHHLSLGGKVFGIGIGTTAYVLGMRHAFDVDHIAAIDNTTRALMERKQRPLSV